MESPPNPQDAPARGTVLDVSSTPANGTADLSAPEEEERPSRYRRRRYGLPLVLFLLTCLSTLLAGATQFMPAEFLRFVIPLGVTDDFGIYPRDPSLMPLRRQIYTHFGEGLLYMGCVLAILMTHEMGHFLMAVLYRVRASLPYFIPLPISPIGTMGAVIAMDSRIANRKQIFDIGLAGPLAGLVVAVPIMWLGVQRMEFAPKGPDSLQLPLAMSLAVQAIHPADYHPGDGFALSRANPFLMAGWVGLLVTGLNMLPVSQLDGGHVTYALLGKKAHWLARGFMAVALIFLGFQYFAYGIPPGWILMIALVLLIGTDHPPTRDDTVKLGWFRTALGYASLLIPVFCFVPNLQI